MADPIIELRNVSKIYRLENMEVKAVDDVTLNIMEGEFVAIMGPSGSGKSTLMHLIGLLDKPTRGKVFIEGEDTEKLSENDLAKLRNKKIGFVFQAFNLLPKTGSLSNVELTLIYSGVNARERNVKAKAMLEKVGLGNRLYNTPAQLSGGQQQRVAVARALINNPLLIIADEPTGNLDTKSGHEILELLINLNNQGHTIVIVTHDPEIAGRAKRTIKILDGKIIS